MTDEERELLAILRDGRPEMRQAILGYFDVLLAGSCSLCCGTGSLYRTEQQASGWVAIFEDCPGCIPPRSDALLQEDVTDQDRGQAHHARRIANLEHVRADNIRRGVSHDLIDAALDRLRATGPGDGTAGGLDTTGL